MARGIRFKVFKAEVTMLGVKAGHLFPDRFYAHMIAGNNEIIWQSEGYEEKASAFQVCEVTWLAMGYPGSVPYVLGSITPLS